MGVFLYFFISILKISHISGAIELSYIMEVTNMEKDKVMTEGSHSDTLDFQKLQTKYPLLQLLKTCYYHFSNFLPELWHIPVL